MHDDTGEGATPGATVTPDARWMTYGELAAFLGIEEPSARRRVQRERWPRRTGNDGKARIAVPGDVQPGEAAAKGADAGEDASRLGEHLARERERAEAARMEAAAAMGELRAIREHLARERERAEAAERDREAARVEAGAAERAVRELREELTRERERAEAAERDREAARVEAATAEGAAQVLREELGQAQAQAADATEALLLWREGGMFARAWRALFYR